MFQQDQEIFNILLDAVSEGVFLVDEFQKIVEVNESAGIMFGYERKELLNQSISILVPQDNQARHNGQFEGFVKRRERRKMGQGIDIYGARKDGNIFPIEISLNPFSIYRRNFTMALVVDITERKKVEEEKNHLATIFHESLNEIYVFDEKNLKFINANHCAQRNLEYSLEELKRMTPMDVIPEYTEAKFRKKIDKLFKNDAEKIEFESVHKRKSGTTYPISIHLQRSKIANRAAFVAIILDITERKNYTTKLEETVAKRTEELNSALASEKELNELKTKFLSLVSHEFKTPLSCILTSTMLLSKYKLADQQDRRDKQIKTISDEVRYLNKILNDFLSVDKLDKGKVNYKFKTFQLSRVVNEVVYNANLLLKDGQKINYPENIDEFSLYQDEKIIELSLSNLVHNAIKYSSENTIVDIIITQNENTTVFKVIDNGIGIPLKDQKNIFNRYFRAENVLLTQGTGIGLNIVKDHIENLKGKVYFESIEHEGSIFTLEIPNKSE